MKRFIALGIGGLLLAGLGYWAGYSSRAQEINEAFLEGALSVEAYNVVDHASVLLLLEQTDQSRLRTRLEHQLSYALDNASQLIEQGAQLHPLTTPYLLEGLSRASNYVQSAPSAHQVAIEIDGLKEKVLRADNDA